MGWLKHLINELRLILSQPTHELNRAQRWVRHAVELARYSGRMLREHRAPQMAAALTYRTIFSLVPLLVVGLLVIRMFSGFEGVGTDVRENVYEQVITWLAGGQSEGQPGSEFSGSDDMRQAMELAVEKLNDIISNVSFGSIGFVGILLLLWAALVLLITAEQSFNTIYGAPAGRLWHMRVVIYWAVISLGPVLLLISVYAAGQIGNYWQEIPVVGAVFQFLSRFAALMASWVLLFLMYRLMPNAHVRARPALIGSFTSAVLWETLKWALILYISSLRTPDEMPYAKLYGSLFLVPLFLFWLYVSWLIVLFGLEITYTLQTLPDYRRKQWQARLAARASGDPMWLFPLITRVAEAFGRGEVLGRQQLAEDLDLPLEVVVQLADRLESEGLVHQVQSTGTAVPAGYALAIPAESIAMTRVLDIATDISQSAEGERSSTGWQYLGALADAQRTTIGDATLASVLADRQG